MGFGTPALSGSINPNTRHLEAPKLGYALARRGKRWAWTWFRGLPRHLRSVFARSSGGQSYCLASDQLSWRIGQQPCTMPPFATWPMCGFAPRQSFSPALRLCADSGSSPMSSGDRTPCASTSSAMVVDLLCNKTLILKNMNWLVCTHSPSTCTLLRWC